MAYLQYFPPSILALQEELKHHPELQKLLSNHPSNELEVKLAEIAAYCQVLLDGIYTAKDLEGLADVLVRKLQEKRSLIILPY